MIHGVRFLRLAVLSSGLLATLAFCRAADSVRSEMPLAADWKFRLGDGNPAQAADFDDSLWSTISLPHTWNAADGQDGGGNYFRGDGWYRRHFRVDNAWKGRRIFLQFDGANRTAEVFLNGRRIGLHRGSSARFRFDVTDSIDVSGDNVLAVRVSNRAGDNIIPVSADFTFFGGLYRAVSLVATAPVHIDLLDYASPGIYVRTPQVSETAATLDVIVKLANDTDDVAPVRVRVDVIDGEGRVVAGRDTPVTLDPLARDEARVRLKLSDPVLWDGQVNPYLYQVRAALVTGETIYDSVTVPLGLRYFSVDAARGFFLNGRYLDLHGVNRHQNRPDKGWAIDDADEREDFAMIEELGATFVRQSHYQQSQLWNDLADQRGMVMWAELSYVNEVRDNREFFENAKEQLRELIRQNFHHPAICFWSIGNETFVRDSKVMPADANDRLLRELAAVVREEDPFRLSTYASNGSTVESRAGVTDVIGFNHYFGWYRGELADFARWADEQHANRPDLRIGMSEFGAGANVAQHEEVPRKPDAPGQWHPEEWQALYHESYWEAMVSRPWLWCKLVWVMFDFASDGRNEGGTPGINDKGLVTADRKTRKDAFYFYQANWSKLPVLHIAGRRFTNHTAATTSIKVYSNAENIELAINGVSFGSRTGKTGVFHWSGVKLDAGENRIVAQASVGGRQLKDECVWTLEPSSERAIDRAVRSPGN